MTGLPDLTATLAWISGIVFVIAVAYCIPGIIRDFRRDRARERAELTSEQLDGEGRAVTRIHQGDDVARVG